MLVECVMCSWHGARKRLDQRPCPKCAGPVENADYYARVRRQTEREDAELARSNDELRGAKAMRATVPATLSIFVVSTGRVKTYTIPPGMKPVDQWAPRASRRGRVRMRGLR